MHRLFYITFFLASGIWSITPPVVYRANPNRRKSGQQIISGGYDNERYICNFNRLRHRGTRG